MTTALPVPPLAEWSVAILAGGLATRLRPLTAKVPKSLLKIAGEPFLGHQLRLLRSRGLRRVVLCVGYLGEQIQADFGSGTSYGMRIDYSFDGPELLGTGGALKKALGKLSVLSLFSTAIPICQSITVQLQPHFCGAGNRV